MLQTLRKAVTKLEITGYAPASILMHPTDFEGVELACRRRPRLST